MPVNQELFKKIYEQITRYPETHYQGTWTECEADTVPEIPGFEGCGTTRCVAGWALYFHNPGQSIYLTAREIDPACTTDPQTAAAELLGLDPNESDELFLTLSAGQAVELVREYAGIED